MQKVKCLNCGHEQELKDSNIYQDIKGKFTECENCETTYDVEPEEEDY